MPVEPGSTTHCTAQAAMAASAALPPLRRMSMAVTVASEWEVAAAPLRPMATERPGSCRSRMGAGSPAENQLPEFTRHPRLAVKGPGRRKGASDVVPAGPLAREGVGGAGLLALACPELVELVAPGEILGRPVDAAVVVIGCGMQREVGIGQMWPRQGAEIGAAGGDDGVYLVGRGDGTHRHGGDAGLLPDRIGERRLEHATVLRLRFRRGLAGRDVDQVAAAGLQHAGD